MVVDKGYLHDTDLFLLSTENWVFESVFNRKKNISLLFDIV